MSLLTPEETRVLLNQMPRITLTRDISLKQREWRNHPKIHRWTRQNGLISEDDQTKWGQKIASDPSILMFGILSGDVNVGTCGLTSIRNDHGTAEFSLFIAPEYQRKGYGKAALMELLKYGFKKLRLNCIWGETFYENPAIDLFLELGFKKEGKLRQRYFKDGRFIDTFSVSLLEREARSFQWYSY